jgi:hypothetical protein
MTTAAQIDSLAERAKRLSEDRQQAIAETMREMIDEPYQLSEDDMAVLQPALADVEAGRNLQSFDEVDQRTRKLIDTWPR